MKTIEIFKNFQLSIFFVLASLGIILTTINFSYCEVVGDIVKTEVAIENMHSLYMDIDTAVWEIDEDTSYIIYTYSKQVNNKSQIFCYTVDQLGNKSREVKISNSLDLSAYDNEVMTCLRTTYPDRNMPAELTPANTGNNLSPKISCDSCGNVLVVWQYGYGPRAGAFEYSIILGIYLEINPNNGFICFRDGTEPFIISTLYDINPGRAAPFVNIYYFAPEIDCVEDDYFCVVYNEYIPHLGIGERLIVKLIDFDDRLSLYRSRVPDDRTYATPYYNFPVDNRGFRKGAINKAIICKKELQENDAYRMYLVYDGLGNPPANLRNPYSPGDVYMVVLESFRGRNIFTHMDEMHDDDEPGLREESNFPSPFANPQRAARKWSSSVFIRNPLLCLGKDGLVVAYTIKVGDIADPQTTWHVNEVLRFSGELPNLHHEEIYYRAYTQPNILTDIVSAPARETLLLIKQAPFSISLSQFTRLGVRNNYSFDLVDLKGIVIPDSNDSPEPVAEFYFSTGSPGYIYGGKFIKRAGYICTVWAKVTPADYRRSVQQLFTTWTAKICTYSTNYPLLCPEDYLGNNAGLNLRVNINNARSIATLNWNLNGVDQNYINQEWISPTYTVYYFKDDGTIRQVNNAVPPVGIRNGRYEYAAYIVVDFGNGISLKSSIRKFILLR